MYVTILQGPSLINVDVLSFFFSAAEVLNGVTWSEKLDAVFRQNFEQDSTLTWQYFGSADGYFRNYPG